MAIVYKGGRMPSGRTYVTVHEEGKPVRQLKHFVRHSPDGFEWGYGGSGPAELARCILLDHFGEDGRKVRSLADSFYQDFKRTFIERIQADEWAIADTEILCWLGENFVKTKGGKT
jgi:hypothetical protein